MVQMRSIASLECVCRVISSPKFFIRIAELADACEDIPGKQKLAILAASLASTLEAVVETTEERLEERAKEVEMVVKAAAEPDNGEFLVPLLPERVAAMRKALENLDESSLDECFLSTVDAWMNKSNLDGMDLMVQILQTLLQMYAGTQIYRARSAHQFNSKPEAELFDRLLQTDCNEWEREIRKSLMEVSTGCLMEFVVLGLESGSTAQQIQAEYLRELVSRIETIEKSLF
jgi:hypothetical protein